MATVKVLKSKTTAIIFAFVLGGFGAQHFYLGNFKRGFLYLLFCWTLIPAAMGFVEAIRLLTKSEDDFNLQYNPGVFNEKYRKSQQKAQHFAQKMRKLYASFEEYNLEEEFMQLQ